MASGSESPERARADRLADEYARNEKERDLANARLDIRADLRSSSDEDTGVINMKVEQAQAAGALPKIEESEPPAKMTVWTITYTAVKRVPPVGLVVIIIVGMLCYTVLKFAGVVR